MIVSSPFSTVGTLPDTGASRNAAPVAATASPTRRTVSGAIVLISRTTWAGPLALAAPSLAEVGGEDGLVVGQAAHHDVGIRHG